MNKVGGMEMRKSRGEWSDLKGINITKMGRSELRIEFPN